MANNSSGPALIIAALIMGMSMLGAALMLQSSMDKNSLVVAETLSSIAKSAADLAKVGPPAAAPKAPTRAARGNRPDPNRVYAVAVGDAPTRGPKNAAVKLVEWSDFQ